MNTYIKTTILFAAITALLIGLGYIIGGRGGAINFFLISLVMNFAMYWFSDRIALSMAGAHPIDRARAPELYEDIEALAKKMQLPMPAIYMSDSMQPNAFATGRGPSHSAVCITRGLSEVLTRSEIRGVLAHELGHIKNRDILIATIAAVVAGAISSVAHIGMWTGGGNRDDDSAAHPVFRILALIFAPLAAAMLQMALSRTREFAADETGAHISGAPLELASALQKIEHYAKQIPMQTNPALAPLYIQSPISADDVGEFFSTHPATAKRVAKLTEMAKRLT